MVNELQAMLSLSNDKGVLHIPKPKPGWIGGRADGFGFELFHEEVNNKGAKGRTLGCMIDLFKILTWEGKVGIFRQTPAR